MNSFSYMRNNDVLNPFLKIPYLVDYTSRNKIFLKTVHQCLSDLQCIAQIINESDISTIYLEDSTKMVYFYFKKLKRRENREKNKNVMKILRPEGSVVERQRNQSIDKSISSILRVTFDIISNFESSEAVATVLNTINNALKNLPHLILSNQHNSSYSESIDKIKLFIYEKISREHEMTITAQLLDVGLMISTKIGGLDCLLEWLEITMKKMSNYELQSELQIDIPCNTIENLIQAVLIGSGQLNRETKTQIEEFMTIFYQKIKTDYNTIAIHDFIPLMLNLLKEILGIQQCLDTDYNNQSCFLQLSDMKEKGSDEIMLWSPLKPNLQEFIKPVFPTASVARQNTKPTVKQVVLTSRNIIVINGQNEIRCASVNKNSNNGEKNEIPELNLIFHNYWYPIQFHEPNTKISKLVVNQTMIEDQEHFMALTTCGSIYSWGDGSYGKLGHGNTKTQNTPNIIKNLEGFKIRDISCGLHHSSAVSETGRLFCWGLVSCFNNSGRIDPSTILDSRSNDTEDADIQESTDIQNNQKFIADPILMPLKSISQVYCDNQMTVCLDESRTKIYFLGYCKYTNTTIYSPYKINKIITQSNDRNNLIFVLMMNGLLYNLGDYQQQGSSPLYLHPPNELFQFPQCFIQLSNDQKYHRTKFNQNYIYFIDVTLNHQYMTLLTYDGILITWNIENKGVNCGTTLYRTNYNMKGLQYQMNCLTSNCLSEIGAPINIVWYRPESTVGLSSSMADITLHYRSLNPFLYINNWDNIMSIINFLMNSEQKLELVVDIARSLFQCHYSRLQCDLAKLECTKQLFNTIFQLINKCKKTDLELNQKLESFCLTLCRIVYLDADTVTYTILEFLEEKSQPLQEFKKSEICYLQCLLCCYNHDQYMIMMGTMNMCSYDCDCTTKTFVKYNPPPFTELLTQKANMVFLGNLLFKFSQIIADYLKFSFQRATLLNLESMEYLLFKSVSFFMEYAYQIYLSNIVVSQNIKELNNHFCALLPIINSVFSALYKCITVTNQQNKQSYDNLISLAQILSNKNSLLGGILIQLLKTLLLQDKSIKSTLTNELSLLSILPHLSSLLIGLDKINRLLLLDNRDNQYVHWPIFGFSSCLTTDNVDKLLDSGNSRISNNSWKWLLDLERLVGVVIGHMYRYLLRVITQPPPDINVTPNSDFSTLAATNLQCNRLINPLLRQLVISENIFTGIPEIEKFYRQLSGTGLRFLKDVDDWKFSGRLYDVGFMMSSLVFNIFQGRYPNFEITQTGDEENRDNLDSFKRSIGLLIDRVDKFYNSEIKAEKNSNDVIENLLYRCNLINKKLEDKIESLYQSRQLSSEYEYDLSFFDSFVFNNDYETDSAIQGDIQKSWFNQICYNIGCIMTNEVPDSDEFSLNKLLCQESKESNKSETKAFINLLNNYVKVIDSSKSVLDSVFLQIVSSLVESITVIGYSMILDDEGAEFICNIIKIIFDKLSSYINCDQTEIIGQVKRPNRLIIMLLQCVTHHFQLCLSQRDRLYQLLFQNQNGMDYFDCIIKIISIYQQNKLVPCKKWLVIVGEQDDNINYLHQANTWICFEIFILIFRDSSLGDVDYWNFFQHRWCSMLQRTKEEYSKWQEERILDMHCILNLTKYLLINRNHNRISLEFDQTKNLLNLLYDLIIDENSDMSLIYCQNIQSLLKYSINKLAIDCYFLIIPSNIEEKSNEFMKETIEKFGSFYYKLLMTHSSSEVEKLLNTWTLRCDLHNTLKSSSRSLDQFSWINFNSNFQLESLENCNLIQRDLIEIPFYKSNSLKECNDIFVLSQETLSNGIWKLTLCVQFSTLYFKFKCGFVDDISTKQRPLNLNSYKDFSYTPIQIELSSRLQKDHIITIIVDFDQETLYYFDDNQEQLVHISTQIGRIYRLFIHFMSTPGFDSQSTAKIQLCDVSLLSKSCMVNHQVKYFQSIDCCVAPDEMLLYERITTNIRKWLFNLSEQNNEIVFHFYDWFLELLLTDQNYRSMSQWNKSGHGTNMLLFLLTLILKKSLVMTNSVYRNQECLFSAINGDHHLDTEKMKLLNNGIIIHFQIFEIKNNDQINFNLPKSLCLQQPTFSIHSIECLIYSTHSESIQRVPFFQLLPPRYDLSNHDILDLLLHDSKNLNLIVRILNGLQKIFQNFQWIKNDIENMIHEQEKRFISSVDCQIELEKEYVKLYSIQLYTEILESETVMKQLFRINNTNEQKLDQSTKLCLLKHYQSVLKYTCHFQPLRGINSMSSQTTLQIVFCFFENFNRIYQEYYKQLPRKIANCYMASSTSDNADNKGCKFFVHFDKSTINLIENALFRLNGHRNFCLLDSLPEGIKQSETVLTFNQRRLRAVSTSPSSSPTNYGNLSTLSVSPLIPHSQLNNAFNQSPQNEYDNLLENLRTSGNQFNASQNTSVTNVQRQITSYFSRKKPLKCIICSKEIKEDLFQHISKVHPINCGKNFRHIANQSMNLNGSYTELDNTEVYYCATIKHDKYIVCTDFLLIKQNDGEKLYDHPLINCSGTFQTEYYHIEKFKLEQMREFERHNLNKVGILGEKIDLNIYNSKVKLFENILHNTDTDDIKDSLELEKSKIPLICTIGSNCIKKVMQRLAVSTLVINCRNLIGQIMKLIYSCESKQTSLWILNKLMEDVSISDYTRLFKWIEYRRIRLKPEPINTQNSISVLKIKFTEIDMLYLFVEAFEMWFNSLNETQSKTVLEYFLSELESLICCYQNYLEQYPDSDANINARPSYMTVEMYMPTIMKYLFNQLQSGTRCISDLNLDDYVKQLSQILVMGISKSRYKGTKFQRWCIKHVCAIFKELDSLSFENSIMQITAPIQIGDKDGYMNNLVTHHVVDSCVTGNDTVVQQSISYTTNNGHTYVVTADSVGTIRIWDVTSEFTNDNSDNLKQTFLFSLKNTDDLNIDDDTGDNAINMIENCLQVQQLLPEDISSYLMDEGVQKLVYWMFEDGSKDLSLLAESIGVVLNVWVSNPNESKNPFIFNFHSIITLLEFVSNSQNDYEPFLLVATAAGKISILKMSFNTQLCIVLTHVVIKDDEDLIQMVPSSITCGTWLNINNLMSFGYHNGEICRFKLDLTEEAGSYIGTKISLPPLHKNRINNLIYCPSEFAENNEQLMLSSAASESTIGIWSSNRLLCALDTEADSINSDVAVTCVQWCPMTWLKDCYGIFVGDNFGTVSLYSLTYSNCMTSPQLKKLFNCWGHLKSISSINAHENFSECLLITSCQAGWIRIWSLGSHEAIVRVILLYGDNINGSSSSPQLESPSSSSINCQIQIVHTCWLHKKSHLIYVSTSSHPSVKIIKLTQLISMKQWAVISSYFKQLSKFSQINLNNMVFLKQFSLNFAHSVALLISEEQTRVESIRNANSQLVYSPFAQSLIEMTCRLPGLVDTIKPIRFLNQPNNIYNKSLNNMESNQLFIHKLNLGIPCHFSSSCEYNTNLSFIVRVNEFVELTQFLMTSDNSGVLIHHKSPPVQPPEWWWNFTIDCIDQEYSVKDVITELYDINNSDENHRYAWTVLSQKDLVDWFINNPEDWSASVASSTSSKLYGWGYNQIGQLARQPQPIGDDSILKNLIKEPIELVVRKKKKEYGTVICGTSCTMVIHGNHTLMGTGEGAMIWSGPYVRQESSQFTYIPVLSDLRVSYVSISQSEESHIVAVTIYGDLYSWGHGNHGKLGHGNNRNCKRPKLIDALLGKPAVQAACGHNHTVIVCDDGSVYSFGLGDKGQLGIEMQGEEQQIFPCIVNINSHPIGMAACGENHTILLSQDGTRLFVFGDGSHGKLGNGCCDKELKPRLVHIQDSSRIVKIVCGQVMSGALTEDGRVYTWGNHEYTGIRDCTSDILEPQLVTNLINTPCFELVCSNYTMCVLIEPGGELMGWGSNKYGVLLQNLSVTHVYTPTLLRVKCEHDDKLESPNWKQVSCADTHIVVSNWKSRPYRCISQPGIASQPLSPPTQLSLDTLATNDQLKQTYPHLIGQHSKWRYTPLQMIGRLSLVLYWHELARLTWRWWLPQASVNYPTSNCTQPHSHPASVISSDHCFLLRSDIEEWTPKDPLKFLYPLGDWSWSTLSWLQEDRCRRQLVFLSSNCDSVWWSGALQRSIQISGLCSGLTSSSVIVQLDRISSGSKPLFEQTMNSLVNIESRVLRVPWRAWQVKLLYEGADDAGGAYDESLSEICVELREQRALSQSNQVLIPTSDSTSSMLLQPFDAGRSMYFLGQLIAVAIRTTRPLALILDPIIWLQLTCSNVPLSLLAETDVAYYTSLNSMKNFNCNEMTLADCYGVENFTAHSCTHRPTEVVYNGINREVTRNNVCEYVDRVMDYRVREFRNSISDVRRGMYDIIPLALFDIAPAHCMEQLVCGASTITVSHLKLITRYIDLLEDSDLIQWFWRILESFTSEEMCLFLRFVTGKSRLPSTNSQFHPIVPFHLFICPARKASKDSLPLSQTCFNQLRLPNYSDITIMENRIRFAITQCRCIDMDAYMLNNTATD